MASVNSVNSNRMSCNTASAGMINFPILTDLKKFTGRFLGKFAVKWIFFGPPCMSGKSPVGEMSGYLSRLGRVTPAVVFLSENIC